MQPKRSKDFFEFGHHKLSRSETHRKGWYRDMLSPLWRCPITPLQLRGHQETMRLCAIYLLHFFLTFFSSFFKDAVIKKLGDRNLHCINSTRRIENSKKNMIFRLFTKSVRVKAKTKHKNTNTFQANTERNAATNDERRFFFLWRCFPITPCAHRCCNSKTVHNILAFACQTQGYPTKVQA